jgi:hypothetical protein
MPLYAAEGGRSAESGGRKAGGESGVRRSGGESGARRSGGETGAPRSGGESGVRRSGGESGARRAGGESGAPRVGGEAGGRKAGAETGATGAQEAVAQRQENQERRIEQGIKKGYLTEEEIARLKTQQNAIGQLEASLTGDGQLTKDEATQLRQALQNASLLIWTEKHDQEGNTMPVYRLGKDVSLKADIAQELEDPNLTREEARAFAKDFHRAVQIKRMLGSANLTEQDQAKLQAEYDALMAKYFDIKPVN